MAIFEIFLINFLIFLTDITFNYYGFLTSDPNPYVLFSIYVSSRYGLFPSLLVGLSSTILTIVSLFIQYGISAQQLIVSWGVLRVPFLILVISVVVGVVRDIKERKIKDLENILQLTESALKDCRNNLEKYESITDNLEKKILLEEKGIAIFTEKLRDLEVYNVEDVFNEAIELIAQFIEAQTISIYVLGKNDFLRLKVRKGPAFLPNSFPLTKSKVISNSVQKGSFSLADLYISSESFDLSYEPALSVPIKRKDKLFGFVLVEIISPEHLNRSSQMYLQVLADWLASTLDISAELSEVVITDDITKFLAFFQKINERFEKFGIPYSFIYGKVQNISDFEQVKRSIRETDYLFLTGNEFRIILTSCAQEGLNRVIDILRKIPDITIEEAYTVSQLQ